MHLIVFNKTYKHDPVSSLGLLSVWDGVMEGAPNVDSEAVLKALLEALQRDPKEYRADAARLEAWAGGKSGVEDLLPAAGGDEVQQELATMAGRHAEGDFLYTKYMAIGLFRLLELGKATDPESLKAMVEALNLDLEKVQTDLQEHPVEDGQGEGADGGGAAARAEEDRRAAGGEGQGRGRGRRGRRPGGRERLSLCPLPRLENTPPTHAPHDAPRTAARAAAPR